MMAERAKTGGRQKGTPNKAREDLVTMIAKAGCMHPVEGLAKIAQQTFDEGEFTISVQAFKELAQYVTPKLKAIEHSGGIESKDPLVIILDNSKE